MRPVFALVLLLVAYACGAYHMAHVTTYYSGTTCAANKAFHAVGVIDDYCNMHGCAVYHNNSFATTCGDFPPVLKFPMLAQIFSDATCSTLRNVTGYSTGTCVDLPNSSVVAVCRSDGKAAFFRYGASQCKGQYTNELFTGGACAPWGNGGSIRVTCH